MGEGVVSLTFFALGLVWVVLERVLTGGERFVAVWEESGEGWRVVRVELVGGWDGCCVGERVLACGGVLSAERWLLCHDV